MDTTLVDGLYDCSAGGRWVLVHDSVYTIVKALSCRATTSHEGYVMVDFDTEALLDAAIITLGLIDLPDEV